MLGHFLMHTGYRIGAVEIACKAENIYIAHLTVSLDQLATKPIQVRTTKCVHRNPPWLLSKGM